MKFLSFLVIVCCLIRSLFGEITFDGDSHIGYVAQIVLYANQVISCATQAWTTFENDALQKIDDFNYSSNFFLKDIRKIYDDFSRKYPGTLSLGVKNLLAAFNSKLNDSLTNVRKSFSDLHQNFNGSAVKFESIVENLTRSAYSQAIYSLSRSVRAKKNCTIDIINAFVAMYSSLNAGLSTCTGQLINNAVIDSELSNGYAVATTFFLRLRACATQYRLPSIAANIKVAQICITRLIMDSEATLDQLRYYFGNATKMIDQINYRFPLYIDDCMANVQSQVEILITEMVKAANDCEQCLNCTGNITYPTTSLNLTACNIGQENSFLIKTFEGATNIISALEKGWKSYRDDSKYKVQFLYGSSVSISTSASQLLYFVRDNYATYLDINMNLFWYLEYVIEETQKIVITPIFQINNVIEDFNGFFRSTIDSLILDAHDALSEIVVNNWDNVFCREGLLNQYIKFSKVLTDTWGWQTDNLMDVNIINVELSKAFAIWFDIYSEFSDCLVGVSEDSSTEVKLAVGSCTYNSLLHWYFNMTEISGYIDSARRRTESFKVYLNGTLHRLLQYTVDAHNTGLAAIPNWVQIYQCKNSSSL